MRAVQVTRDRRFGHFEYGLYLGRHWFGVSGSAEHAHYLTLDLIRFRWAAPGFVPSITEVHGVVGEGGWHTIGRLGVRTLRRSA